MNIKNIIIMSTMALVISLSSGVSGYRVSAQVLHPYGQEERNVDGSGGEDPLLASLGVKDDKKLYDQLLEGQSLADIATENQASIDDALQVQTTQLQGQIIKRYQEGQISLEQLKLQLQEAEEIIANSAFTRYSIGI